MIDARVRYASYYSAMWFNLVPRRLLPTLIGTVALLGVFGALGYLASRRPPAAPPEPTVPRLQALPISARALYAGNEACAGCHPQEFRAHAASEHVRAMSRVTEAGHGAFFRKGNEISDERQNLRYRTAVQAGQCVLIAASGDEKTTAVATYGFGSGKHGITYLGKQGDLDLELRLSYYPDAKQWSYSPGQSLTSQSGGAVIPTGLIKPEESVEGCFVCHSTFVAREGGRLLPDTVRMGVGCETCHGPGRAHIAAKERGERDSHLVKLGSLSPQQIGIQLCGQCHRSPATDDIHDPFNQGGLARFQGLALAQSLCFTNSGGRLSCLTCHDPHDQKRQPRTFYNAKCASCHTGASADSRACSIDPKGDCVSCHMPAQTVGMPFGLRYRTHWIKVWAGR